MSEEEVIARGIERYGLRENPFLPRQIDPLASEADEKLLIQVDGFSRLQEIEECIKRALAAKEPAFFLVTGRSGSGRSSAANFILSRFRKHSKVSADRFIVPERTVRHRDEFGVFQNWLIYLLTEIDDLQPFVNVPVSELKSEVNNAQRETMEPTFHGVLRRIHRFMRNAESPAAFACCLENVPSISFINAARQIFARAPTVCVFTVKDYEEGRRDVIEPFQKDFGNTYVIELSPLNGSDVRVIVEERWKVAFPQRVPPCPFELSAIEEAFGNEPRTIGRVMALMSQVLDLKVANNDSGPLWPQDTRLGFSAEELRSTVPILERPYG